ncbi:uncharacterized protein PHACADRAFT_157167 [Phanerochaete carnosa HHB-10118-sp]|uniref:Uncharacterized protein n=1 Tax=Phanerochaete carnosa (strain HHB-10118-sp) TaxID=650164 RepID=K5X7N4_PHACS|nr:uncharacterized protein PHACADRAFT_157167 [Phanerochaete carnosa HHB-10118-sp]EKM58847.1 hypothetical protein PHACADRAFT_157167 [Phanerochaete carnosa HHB-10118-sp]
MDGLPVQRLGIPSPPLSTGTLNVHGYPPNATTAVGFSTDDLYLVSGSADAAVVVWDVQSGERVFAIGGQGAQVGDVKSTLDGSRIVSASDHGSAKGWDARLGWPICTYALGAFVQLAAFETATGAILDAKFFPDGERTMVLDNYRAALVYRAGTREELIEPHGHGDRIKPRAFAPDGIETIASRGTAISYSPNGALLAAAGRDGEVVVWDAWTGQFAIEFKTSVRHLSGQEEPLSLWNVSDVLHARSGG